MPDSYGLLSIPILRSKHIELPVARSFANERDWYGGSYLNPPKDVLSLKYNEFDPIRTTAT
jgi:hypothetical protein